MSEAKRRTKKRTKTRAGARLAPWLRGVLIAVPITLGVGLLLLLLATRILLTTKDPGANHRVVGVLICFLCTLLGGWIASRLAGRSAPLLCGAGMGLCLFALLSFAAFFPIGNADPTTSAFLRLGLRVALIPTALCGSFLGAKSKKRKHHR